MPFIPHTENEITQMLNTIGADSIEDLFDEIPAHLRAAVMDAIPSGLNEMDRLPRVVNSTVRTRLTRQKLRKVPCS